MAVGSSSSASSTAASLAPGFRFHPTDEELVRYYLRRKVCGKPFRFDAISEIDIYKAEPWELPGLSKLKTRDLEWYFFSFLDKKYGNGSRTNRATEKGYWKTTGKDRAVYHRSRIVGMKKTLVFHSGRAPRGERTNWVMHEYRLVDEELENVGITQDAFVLCRVFHKSGSGPKNGEKYGAPFVENEWEDDELEMVPKEEVQEEVIFDDAYLDGTDLEQILGDGILDVSPPPSDSYYGGNNNYAEESADLINDAQRAFVDMDEIHCKPEQPDEQKFFNLPVQNNIDGNPVKREYIGETSNTDNSEDIDYLIDETFVDASSANPQYMNEAAPYLETNDLQNPMESNTSGFDMLEEYLTFFDADYDGTQYLDFDSSAIMGNENKVTDQASPIQKQMDGETEEAVIASQELLHGHDNEVASSLKQDSTEFESDFKNPIIKHANRMLGSIPAPSAFASEFPSKNAAAIRFNSQSSSSSGHVTAGLVRIRNLTLSGTTDFSFGKHGNVNITLSFDLSREPYDSESSSVGIVESKSVSAMPRAWFYALVLCVLIVCVSFKIGTHICAKVN